MRRARKSIAWNNIIDELEDQCGTETFKCSTFSCSVSSLCLHAASTCEELGNQLLGTILLMSWKINVDLKLSNAQYFAKSMTGLYILVMIFCTADEMKNEVHVVLNRV